MPSRHRWEVEIYFYEFSTPALNGGWVVNDTPRPLWRYPLYRRLDRPRGRSGRVRKISPPRFEPRTVQHVVSRYSNYAIPAGIFDCTNEIYDLTYKRLFCLLDWIFGLWYCCWKETTPVICSHSAASRKLNLFITLKYRQKQNIFVLNPLTWNGLIFVCLLGAVWL